MAMLRLRGRAAGAGVTLAASPTFAQNAWAGVLLPARTPQAIVAKLNAVINEGLTSPEAKTNLLKFSAITQPGTPEQFVKFIAEQSSIWASW